MLACYNRRNKLLQSIPFGKKSHYDLTKNYGIEVLGELPISENLIKNHDVDHPIIKQKQSDFIFKSFFDISQKVIDKIKV